MKKKILFFGEGIALSHIVRPLYLASCLDKEQFEISFACSNRYKRFVEGKVDNYYEIPSMSPEEFNLRIEKPIKVFDKKIISQYVDSELKLFSKIKPDIVIGDMRVSLAISARMAKIPYISLANAYWSPFSAQDRQMPEIMALSWLSFEKRMKLVRFLYPLVVNRYICDYNKIRVKAGLSSVKSMEEMHSDGDWCLYLDVPELAPTKRLPDTHQYIGPITEFVDNELPDWWQDIKTDKPIIYFSIGSTGNLSILKYIINALKKLPITVIMATAGKDIKEKLPENFFVSNYLPALTVIKKSDLVICNGGSGTIYQALSEGKPILAFPTNMDQFLAMERVEKKGVGKLIRPSFANEDSIANAIQDILNDPSWSKNSNKIQLNIKEYNVKIRFSDFINKVTNE